MWVDAFGSDLNNAANITTLVNRARAANLNAIFPQVRRRGDAWYRGGLEPINSSVAAGFDPLRDLLTKAHDTSGGKRRIEVHPWLVTYNIWNQQNTPPSQPTHPYNRHPEWLTQRYPKTANAPVTRWDGGNYQFDQGLPAVQQHTFDVAMDILRRYDVDGLHFDYIRYSDNDSSGSYQPWGYHPETVARYQRLKNRATVPTPSDPTWLQWRRDQVTALLRKVYLHARTEKPAATISAALICYGSAPSLSSSSWLGTAAYSRVLQDWRAWLDEGILDLGCPMAYKTNLTSLIEWTTFIRQRQYDRASAIGLYWHENPLASTFEQIRRTRASSGANRALGQMGYSFRSTNSQGVASATFYQALTNAATAATFDPDHPPVYAEPSEAPAMPWKADQTLGHVMGFAQTAATPTPLDGVTVTLAGPVNRTLLTDGTGFFGAVDLPVGSYTASIAVEGFAPQERAFTVTGAQVASLEFLLHPPAPRGLEILTHFWNDTTRRLTLIWASQPDLTYRVRYSADLQQWHDLATGLPSAGETTTYETPPMPEAITRRFWRVEAE